MLVVIIESIRNFKLNRLKILLSFLVEKTWIPPFIITLETYEEAV